MPVLLGTRRALRRRGSVAAPAFAPSDISGLQLWFKADALTLNAGDSVSSWTDSSSNANHATQALSFRQPTFRSAPTGFNSKPAVQFDGGDWLSTGANVTLGVFSIFVVFRATANGAPFAHNTTGVDGGYLYTTTGVTTRVARSGVTSSKSRAANWGSDDTVRVVAVTFGGTHATHLFYINGTAQSMSDNGTGDPGTGTQAAIFSVGSDSALVIPLSGHIAELLVYDSVLSSTNRGNVTSYLGQKYAVSVA